MEDGDLSVWCPRFSVSCPSVPLCPEHAKAWTPNGRERFIQPAQTFTRSSLRKAKPGGKQNRVPRSEDNRRNPGNFRISVQQWDYCGPSVLTCTEPEPKSFW